MLSRLVLSSEQSVRSCVHTHHPTFPLRRASRAIHSASAARRLSSTYNHLRPPRHEFLGSSFLLPNTCTRLMTTFGSSMFTDKEDSSKTYDIDLAVIGGGSGGLACSKEAAKIWDQIAKAELSTKGESFEKEEFLAPKKIVCFDYVKPSPAGSKWGLGGTCVNVGCIPKKLYHQAALLKEAVIDAEKYGWDVKLGAHRWQDLKNAISDYIGGLNWGYRVALRDKKVDYKNELVEFVDDHTLLCTNKKGKTRTVTARRIVVAVGTRPTYPEIPGAELGITSDDIFALDRSPGKTLVVGGSYVALECAGFLSHLGFETHLCVRSIFLRGFDQQIADMIGAFMDRSDKLTIKRPAVPIKIEKVPRVAEEQASKKLKQDEESDSALDYRLKVTFKDQKTGEETSDVYDTVLYAIGRYADTPKLQVDKAGVKTNPKNGKIIVNAGEQTNVPHIYALGDVIDGGLELTPVAIQAGRLLANRLYNNQSELMDYVNVATTVFTPLEYGCIGYSEEDAIAKFGEKNIEVYHIYYQPLEWNVAQRQENTCYAKLVCNLADNERVVGFHVLGPNAGEVTQGYAVAILMGATKKDFDRTVGIHPTTSEEFTGLWITKRSGEAALGRGC